MKQASKLVETASREPLGISLTRLTSSMPWSGLPVAGQQFGERLSGAFHARGDHAGRDHRGFQQSQVVAGEIENLRQLWISPAALRSTLTRRSTGSSITRR